MSLSQDITNLVTATNNLTSTVDGKIAEIDNHVNTAIDTVVNSKSVTYYVDALNGNDNNDGSSGSPFQTIKKACDSVPVGGAGVIVLANAQTHIIDSYVNSVKKLIQFKSNYASSDPNKPDGNSPIIKFADDGTRLIGGIFFSDGTLVFGLWGFPVIVEAGDGTAPISGAAVSGHKSAYSYGNDGSTSLSSLQIVHSEVRVSSLFATHVKQITIRFGTIKVLQGSFFSNCGFGTLNFQSSAGVVIDGSGNNILSTCISGIVRDANGTPRNIISNVIF